MITSGVIEQQTNTSHIFPLIAFHEPSQKCPSTKMSRSSAMALCYETYVHKEEKSSLSTSDWPGSS